MTSNLQQAENLPKEPNARGGLADVYRMTLKNGPQVAVKSLHERPGSDSKILKRTARELDTWSNLDHQNILQLWGLAIFRDKLSMVSPWAEHGSVVAAIKERPDVDRYVLCTQLANAVAYLHSAEVGVIHGDIKGANVLLDEHDCIKLTDFGLAIMHEQSARFSETDPGGGTMRWMAPELFAETGVRCRETDIYALGMTMMEIITGRVPFSEIRSTPVVITAVSRDKRVPDVPELRADHQHPRETLMLGTLYWCWKYEPEARMTAAQVKMQMALLGSY